MEKPFDPTMSQRDPSKPWNQLWPKSLRDNGTNLDEGFEDISGPPVAQNMPTGTGE